jgi:L-alanine-DL-glutamate epimerase-like enolase superfamily enzyme
MRLKLRSFELPLAHRFGIARGSIDTVHSLIVELGQDGYLGYGEAIANAYYGTTLDSLTDDLESARRFIESTTLQSPKQFSRQMESELSKNPFARCALDEAAWDLCGKLLDRPAWKILGLSLNRIPFSNYTIGASMTSK